MYVDNRLALNQHCLQEARIAYLKSKLFFKAFSFEDHEFYVFMFTSGIRPIVEIATHVWNFNYDCQIALS